ncbi:MAG: hypothetical protein IPO18_09350 [bacterium]|nr:hypothetical protein [bacterium]
MWTRGVGPRGERAVVFGIGDTGLRVVEDVGDGTLRTIFRAPPPVDDAVPSYFAAVATSDGWIVWGEPGVFGLRARRRRGGDHGAHHVAPPGSSRPRPPAKVFCTPSTTVAFSSC